MKIRKITIPVIWLMGVILVSVFSPSVLAFQLGCRNAVVVDRLPDYPEPITNNAVTSVLGADGRMTMYSFMGITNPVGRNSIVADSFRMTVPGDEGWVRIADAPLLNGLAKIGATAIAVQGRIFLIGGYAVSQRAETTEKRLFEYDPVGDQYIERAAVPVEVDDTVAGVYQNRYIYLISGWHGPVGNNVADVQIYDVESDKWGEGTPIVGPLPGLFGHSGTIVGNSILYCDGVTTPGGFKISSRVFAGVIDPDHTGRFDVIQWGEIAAHPGLPTYRGAVSQGGAGVGDHEDGSGELIFLVGGTDNPYNFTGLGYDGNLSEPLDQLLAFDVRRGEWVWPDLVLGDFVATMDHRGLVGVGDDFGEEAWVTVGGMTEARLATTMVQRYRVVRDQPVMMKPVPGVAGEVNSVEVHCGIPGRRVVILYSEEVGATEVPGCPGLVLSLENPRVVGDGVYDEDGVAVVESVVPDVMRGVMVYLQAVELGGVGGCRVSNGVAVRFE